MGRDREWFEELWRDHADAVYAFAARRAGLLAADDVVADTFAIAWRRRDGVRDLGLPWLLGVARRVVADHARAEARHQRRVGRVLSLASPRPAEFEDPGGSDVALVVAALQHLSARDREVLTLIAWDELTHEEAAAVLGCSVGALAVRLHRARRRLQRLLAATSGGAPESSPQQGSRAIGGEK